VTETVQITRSVYEALLAQARNTPETECCGLLGGRDGVITSIFPATNAANSATAFEIAPEELFSMFKQMRAEALQHLGIYHSHPHGPNLPSPADVKRAFYPDVAHVILSPNPRVAHPARAFRIHAGRFAELRIEIV